MSAQRILRTPEARQDLLDIWASVSHEGTADLADAFLLRLYGALDMVSVAPHIGRERPESSGAPHSIVVRPYVIFYRPLLDDGGILAWRVIHGAHELRRPQRRPQGGVNRRWDAGGATERRSRV